ncbi:hypothetical protein DFP72DRAFT_1079583 [Ephemerocybe angulata]|uniref:Uncharacterized protein n=1 Tax=Ephemerocybe angulata TaxID=980116 RepID=A0A8H6LV25_9AGAR|nr:hypothetical protein DFP72DRAFT_1079583 [Tulosesus angulatus]
MVDSDGLKEYTMSTFIPASLTVSDAPLGFPKLSQHFLGLRYIRYDAGFNVFAVIHPENAHQAELFTVSQVENIISFHNEAAATQGLPARIPAGQSKFARAWNDEPTIAVQMVHRIDDDNFGRERWIVPTEPIPEAFMSFQDHDSFGQYLDPRLRQLGAYGPDEPVTHTTIIKSSWIEQIHDLLYKYQQEYTRAADNMQMENMQITCVEAISGAPTSPTGPRCCYENGEDKSQGVKRKFIEGESTSPKRRKGEEYSFEAVGGDDMTMAYNHIGDQAVNVEVGLKKHGEKRKMMEQVGGDSVKRMRI